MSDKALPPKQCECGRQGYVKDSRQRTGHVSRRYFCECGNVWSTKEIRDLEYRAEIRKIKDRLADKLIEMAQELIHG